ncbi:MAG: NAD(P)H-hydrate dehydratase [Deltaproteobacteria bacterium]|nr:NAD(P)H-hydrate dehydratase [Deltaproteobacteria bacterium]
MWDEHLFMTRDQIREYDRIAIDELGIPGPVLMENAGRGAARLAAAMCGESRRVAVLAGPGNNGGDGFVIARHLLNEGFDVNTYMAHPRSKIQGDALINLKILEAMSPPLFEIVTEQQAEGLEIRLREDGFVVDALLGTGVSRNIEGHLGNLINMINQSGVPVLAVDIPSGLDADTGRPWGKVVHAEATATFGHLKRGLVIHPGAGFAGKTHVVPIGVPGFVSEKAGFDGTLVSEEQVRPMLPKRPIDAHKGTFGHLLVVAGAFGKTGAAAMVGKSAMRMGTGLVTLATTAQAQPALEAKCLEVMVENIIEKVDASLTEKATKRIGRFLEGKQAVAVGPGLSTAAGISTLVMRLLQMLEVPAVIDADGINILAKDPSDAGRISTPMVFTPHPGEMARLMNKTVPNVQADRIGIAREAAKRHQVVIVLKGAHSVIATPNGRAFVNTTGNPGMASGGMGDVLTGIIGALLAQQIEPLDAALLGVYLHGLAGDRAADRVGIPGLIASDVIEELPRILKEWTA